jgi:hypothetical protein
MATQSRLPAARSQRMGLPVGRASWGRKIQPRLTASARAAKRVPIRSCYRYEMRAGGPRLFRRGPALLISRGSLAVDHARRLRLLDEAIRS